MAGLLAFYLSLPTVLCVFSVAFDPRSAFWLASIHHHALPLPTQPPCAADVQVEGCTPTFIPPRGPMGEVQGPVDWRKRLLSGLEATELPIFVLAIASAQMQFLLVLLGKLFLRASCKVILGAALPDPSDQRTVPL